MVSEDYTGAFKPKNGHTQYYVNGKRVPSVTTILKNLGWGSGALQYWAWDCGRKGLDYRTELDRAANAGTLAHKMVEHYVNGLPRPPKENYEPDIYHLAQKSFEAFLEWAEYFRFKVRATEEALVSREYLYGGTLDIKSSLVSEVKGKQVIVDLKTSKDIYLKFWIQARAYGHLWEETYGERIEGYYILRLGREGDFNYAYKPMNFMEDCWEVFKSLLVLEKFRAQHE